VEEIGQGVSFREAAHLIAGLQHDQGSHLFASLAGWSYPMSRQEFYAGVLLQTVSNALRGEKDEPMRLDWPWPDEDQTPDVSDEERAELRAQLNAASAFAQKRTPEAVASINE